MSHASGVKIDAIAPRSKLYQGPFGRICPELPGWTPTKTTAAGKVVPLSEPEVDALFLEFAQKQMIEAPGELPADIAADNNRIAELEEMFGSGEVADPKTGIPAGYTYFGQFIDHDITFDPASSLMRRNDPNGLLNFRTPRLDLDNVYGRGPDDQPYLYEAHDKAKLLIGQAVDDKGNPSKLRDLPRNSSGTALIGDMRNDENSMVSQLQLGFLLAHNTLVDRARAKGHADPFESARKTLRWLYQWIVWNDFLRRITTDEIWKCALSLDKACGGQMIWNTGLDHIYKWKHQPFMPVEFSVAAYRFGHSMVRNSYQTNHPHRGFGSFAPIFDGDNMANPDDLRGFGPMREKNTIQWDWFLLMDSSGGPFPQRARSIDTKLANALAFLTEQPNVLAYRNLKRAWAFDLPAGTAIARKYCVKPVKLKECEPDSLWFYLLKEAESVPGKNRGNQLGRLGSLIICATFAGLMKGDPCSYLNLDPCWTPDQDDLLCPGTDNRDSGKAWELSSIIRIAGLPVNAEDISEQTAGNFPDTVSCAKGK